MKSILYVSSLNVGADGSELVFLPASLSREDLATKSVLALALFACSRCIYIFFVSSLILSCVLENF